MDDGTGTTPLGQPQVVLYRGDCEFNGLEPVDCNAADAGEGIVSLDVSGLDPGLPYFIRVSDWNATANDQEGTFLLCVREADPIIILDENVTTDLCEGEVYDSGGEGDDYQPNENYTLTITPPAPVSCITFNLVYFNIDNFSDVITFYDGPSTSSPVISSITGNNFSDEGGGGVCYQVQASSGSLTMSFQTDGSVQLDGFYGYWECSQQACDPYDLIEVEANNDPQTIINNLATPLTTVTIDAIDCPEGSIGTFNNGDLTDLGLEKGIVLSSGAVENNGGVNGISNPGTTFASSFTGGGSDPDLDYLSLSGNGALSNDACVLELDVFVATNELRFEYIFRSEEYPEYVNSTFNDIFAFLISGPGIVGDPNINNQENIAVLPPPNQVPVEVNSVNNLTNWEYYRNNADGPSVVYDGLTSDYLGVKKSLTAIAQVQPCTTYHLKMAIADRGDTAFDSGVFIAELKGGTPTIDITYNNGIDYLVEDCTDEEDIIVIDLPTEIDEPQTYSIVITGTATPAVDYVLNLPATITFNPGDTQFSFPISAITDGIDEGVETVEISLVSNFGCGDIAFTTLTIEIHDDLNVEIFAGADTAYVCQGNSILMNVTGAVDYTWISQEPNIFTPSNDIPDPTATPTVDQEIYVLGMLGVCSDIDTIFLDVVDPEVMITPVNPTEFCQGDSVILVAQNNVGNSGVVWSPATGLNDPNSATVIAQPLNNTTYTVTVALEGCSASDQITISVDPFDFPELAADTTVCQNYPVQLATEIPFTTTTYSWTPIDGLDDPTSSAPIAIPDVTTTYTLTATSQNAYCDFSEEITVEVVPADVNIVEPVTDTLEICLGESVNLTALTTTQGVGFSWGPDNGTIFPDVLDTAVVATPTVSTMYDASLVVGACTVYDSIFIRVDSLPMNEISQLVPDQETYCEGDLITIISPTYEPANFPDIEHLWIPMIGFQTPDSLWNLVIQATQSTTYLRITTNNACIDTAEVEIEVIPVTSLTLEPDVASICQGDSIQLTAFSADAIDEIEWTNSGSLSCDDCLTPVATPGGTTTYEVSGMFMDCPVTSNPATISVVNLPDPGLPASASICPDSSITLYQGIIDPNATYTWTSGGSVISMNADASFSPNVTTTFTLTIENGDCVEVYESTINVLNEAPTSSIIEDPLLCAGQSFLLA
ncbi:MAG: choice-of-anchor L domain-containing protein, partial [Phaeodactylibacter sp.]|nr:choice-of-anchor L domain-containing protein [Phaeodactylibacter sp.]